MWQSAESWSRITTKRTPGSRHARSFLRDVLLQVLLAFMFDAAERQTGEQPVEEHIQEIGH